MGMFKYYYKNKWAEELVLKHGIRRSQAIEIINKVEKKEEERFKKVIEEQLKELEETIKGE